ncbi:DUF4124 domain-containing protein [Vibrio methylphosphonaticus]|uniref:DUF4124 domain-containing protein n=1 Tax=Vibrio methylphosphonaticus TaxID=2946866 RepID=UPI002029EE9A|nr:DUF4124 domain-containing protein [Vibrio methylphosphonaticus]MCL9777319.1 DUF4124 domain-containing protein [Vibrio methylphosphonaticus]
MKPLWVVLIISFFSHANTGIDVFVWTDKQGVLHFSDTPDHPTAKRVNMPDMTPPSPEITHIENVKGTGNPSVAENNDRNAKSQPLSIRITSPEHDSTVRSNPGFIEVTGDMSRPLAIGDKLQLLLDGKPYGAPKANPYWSLKYVDRGTHTLMIQVQQSGKVIASSDTITVHLHRTTVQ